MTDDGCFRPLFKDHTRRFAQNLYVYPVLSRRSSGISIGVNLNRDKACNFRCIYCQVDRSEPVPAEPVDLDGLAAELGGMVEEVTSGRLFEGPRFVRTPDRLRRLNDIALSGNGEPTLCPQFAEAARVCAEVRQQHGLDAVKLVLITNASLLHKPNIQRGLEILDRANGEIWAKLDAGTEAFFRRVSHSRVSFSRVLENILHAARQRTVVIQSLFMYIDGRGPSEEELAAYCRRLQKIVAEGGKITLVQVHTVARRPAQENVTALAKEELDAIAQRVHRQTGLEAAAFHCE